MMVQNRSFDFWLVMFLAFWLLLLLLIGQVGALIHYDLMVKLGLQESKEIVGDMGVAINKGFAAGDTIIYAPLIILGMIGLWFKKTWGMILMAAAFGISAYWPMVCLHFLFFSKGLPNFHFTHFVSYTILLSTISILSLLGLFGLHRIFYHKKRII